MTKEEIYCNFNKGNYIFGSQGGLLVKNKEEI
jgi:hypothetical protein